MPRVLVVDDKDENIYMLRALLAGHGFAVTSAKNGAEALAKARRERPDLVISDILMPVMDGFTLCRHWKSDPVLKQVPFIFYTANYTEAKDEQLAYNVGADRFIVKPQEPSAFIEIISAVLEEFRQGRLQARQTNAEPEETYLRAYNEALIRRLESKLTELEETTRTLHDKDEFHQAVLNAMTTLIAVVGLDGVVLSVNRAWEAFPREPTTPALLRLRVGQNVLDAGEALSGEQRQVQDGLREVLSADKNEKLLELPFGSEHDLRWFMVRIERVGARGLGAVVACIDITERKRAEQSTRDESRRKDDFLALLGHELRNPLGSITIAAETLGAIGLDDARAERARQIIERQAAHLARIVDDLLDVARISHGKLALHRERIDWREIVRHTIEDWRPAFESQGIRLEVDLPGTPIWVLGDPTRLAQVATNLLNNAKKFTDRGGEIEIRFDDTGPAESSELIVRDTGIGMSADTLSRLFQPFEQAPQSSARTRGGLGMGLALVKGLVEMHGGEVTASSAGPGRGSELRVRLPRAGEAARPTPAKPANTEHSNVLVIEDNPDAADSLRMFLETAGHSVQVAYDGIAALDMARRRHPDLVFCDIGLPGEMDGYAVARALRADPALSSVPLVALTGYGQAADQARAKQAGFDAHLSKPADPKKLLRAMAMTRARSERR